MSHAVEPSHATRRAIAAIDAAHMELNRLLLGAGVDAAIRKAITAQVEAAVKEIKGR